MGALSDRTGRRPLLLVFAALAVITAYPAMSWLVDQPSFARLLAVELWRSFIYAGYNGAMVVHLTEIVPKFVRSGYSKMSLMGITRLMDEGFFAATGHQVRMDPVGRPLTLRGARGPDRPLQLRAESGKVVPTDDVTCGGVGWILCKQQSDLWARLTCRHQQVPVVGK